MPTTMQPIAANIVSGAERMLGLADALLAGVPADAFARLAAPGGQTVRANHGAFIYGHLALYPARVLLAAGEDASAVTMPEAYTGLFGAGVECRDDPGGSIYPPMDEIVSRFRDSHRALLERVAAWPDSTMTNAHGIEGRLAEMFPTVGQVASFLLLGHAFMHLGQMSTWRRAIGLGSAM